MLYEMAIGEKARVGVIALEPESYNPDRWWTSSAGVRTLIGETIAYLYYRIFFHP